MTTDGHFATFLHKFDAEIMLSRRDNMRLRWRVRATANEAPVSILGAPASQKAANGQFLVTDAAKRMVGQESMTHTRATEKYRPPPPQSRKGDKKEENFHYVVATWFLLATRCVATPGTASFRGCWHLAGC